MQFLLRREQNAGQPQLGEGDTHPGRHLSETPPFKSRACPWPRGQPDLPFSWERTVTREARTGKEKTEKGGKLGIARKKTRQVGL